MITIHVELVDAATNQRLGEADLPVTQLPESFAAATTLHLGGRDWQVVQAEPVTRAEYAVAGRLRLVLREIAHVKPDQILFSVPTLEDALPATRDGDASDAFVMHEDDWRQRELVASAFEPEVAAELASIRAVHDARKGPGFERLHVRKLVPRPLAGVELHVDEVRAVLGTDAVRRQVVLGTTPGVVDGGFAFAAAGGAIYGCEVDGRVAVLGFAGDVDPGLLARVAQPHGLLQVDWCGAQVRSS